MAPASWTGWRVRLGFGFTTRSRSRTDTWSTASSSTRQGKLEHPAGQARAPDFETEAVEAEHELEVAGQMGLIHAALVAVPDRSVDGGPSPTTTPDAWDRARIETVPVFTYNSLDEGGAQLCPCGIATITPQHFTVASRASIHMPTRKFPISTNGRNECAPHPAHIHQHGVSI